MKHSKSWLLIAISVVLLVSACTPATKVPAMPDMEPGDPTYTPTALPPTATPMPEPTATPQPEQDMDEDAPTATPEPPTPTPVVYPETAQYRLTFEAYWSAETHPTNFPRNAHWSGLIGAVHSADASLWTEGGLASPGIKSMAETGAKSPLDNEVQALIDAGTACELISGPGLANSPDSASVEFTATQNCSLVSVVSMIAPSPDWFVGVDSRPLFTADGWLVFSEVSLLAWDAGTDSGEVYTSRNAASNPAKVISQVDGAPLLKDGTVLPLGAFRFERIDE